MKFILILFLNVMFVYKIKKSKRASADKFLALYLGCFLETERNVIALNIKQVV